MIGHLDTATEDLLPLPARNEWGEGNFNKDGLLSLAFSSLREEREKTLLRISVAASRACCPNPGCNVSGRARLLTSPVLLAILDPAWLARTLALPKNDLSNTPSRCALASQVITFGIASVPLFDKSRVINTSIYG